MTRSSERLRVCLVDLAADERSVDVDTLRRMLALFVSDVRATNGRAGVTLSVTAPRRYGDAIPRGCGLYLLSDGPGDPADCARNSWGRDVRALLDEIAFTPLGERPQLFACGLAHHLVAYHFGLGEIAPLPLERAGIQRFALTPAGRQAFRLPRTARALWAFERRRWGIRGLDRRRLLRLQGARLLADPSAADGVAVRLLDAITSVPFHPEAEPTAVAAWAAARGEHADALVRRTCRRTLKLARDPLALPRTYSLVVPSWLHDSYNRVCRRYVLKPALRPHDSSELTLFDSYHQMQADCRRSATP